jgi:branched-chain amino acid transport system substrate-binding protein
MRSKSMSHLVTLTVMSLACLLTLSVTAAAGSTVAIDSSSQGTFNLVVVTPLSGAAASTGQSFLGGVKAATKYLNASGGILGRKINVASLDDADDPTTAVTVLENYLASNPTPNEVVTTTSTEAAAIVPILTRDKILTFSTSNTPGVMDAKKYPYNFSVSAPGSEESKAVLADVRAQGNVKTVGVLISDDVTGEGDLAAMQALFKGTGIKLSVVQYTDTTTNLSGAYAHMLAAHPQAVFLEGIENDCPLLLQARQTANGISIPTYLNSGFSSQPPGPLGYATKTQLQMTKLSVFNVTKYVAPQNRSEALKAFLAGIGATDPGYTGITFVPALGWDAVTVSAAGFDQAKSLSTTAVTSALRSLRTPAKVNWLSFPQYHFGSSNNEPTGQEFGFIQPASLVDGMWKSSGS